MSICIIYILTLYVFNCIYVCVCVCSRHVVHRSSASSLPLFVVTRCLPAEPHRCQPYCWARSPNLLGSIAETLASTKVDSDELRSALESHQKTFGVAFFYVEMFTTRRLSLRLVLADLSGDTHCPHCVSHGKAIK